MNKTNKRKALLDKLVNALLTLEDEEIVPVAEVETEEVKVKAEYELDGGGKIFVKDDDTVYFDDETKVAEANFEYVLADGNKLLTDEAGKFKEIVEKEVTEEELPVEAPIELEEEEVEEYVITVEGEEFKVPSKVFEYVKKLEGDKEKVEEECVTLKSQIPSVSPVGIEMSSSEKCEKKKFTFQDYANGNY